jgi:hypothetical protein
MNTKSVVAVVKKPKVVPRAAKAVPKLEKAVVKKPKVAPKVEKAIVKKPKVEKAIVKKPKVAKAVVKKPKAAKVAKAVVKKPKATPKAVVKKPIKGGVVSGFSIRKMLGLRTTSNAVVPTSNRQVIEETPVVEEPQKAPIEGCVQQSPSILLKKILDDYKALFVDKIIPNKFTVYDLLVLIENIANNLNKFFEDFLHFYPIIIFKVDENGNKIYYDDDMKFLKIQDRFVKINSIIRYYIEKLGNMYYKKPRFWNTKFIKYSLLTEHYTTERNYGTYLDTSKIVYNGILDGTQKGIKEYKRAMLNFFKFKYILKLNDYDMKANSPLILFMNYELYFGDTILSKNLGENFDFNIVIVKELYEILQNFFSYIKFMEINKNKGEIDTELKGVCEKYIKDATNAANTNLNALNELYKNLRPEMSKYINRREHPAYRLDVVIHD